ncbi:MAG: Mpo1-like protein [Burkholderiaceae bacterium]
MSVLTRLLESYEKNHQNPINEAIHIIAIPLIMFSILGMTAAFDIFLEYILVGIVIFYYLKLSKIAALLMLVWLLIYLGLVVLLKPYIIEISILLFAFGWILQFLGHFIEGKRPSFFEDLRYFLIGPLFVVQKVISKFGIKVFTENG